MTDVESRGWTIEGGGRLAARLDVPRARPRAHALFAHCLPDGHGGHPATEIGRSLAAAGIGVLRVDLGAPGESAGSRSSDVDDLVHAADRLRGDGRAPQLLIGQSLGGTALLAAAHRIPEVRAVVTIGELPPSPPSPSSPAPAVAVPLLILRTPDDPARRTDPAASVVTLTGADPRLRHPGDSRWVAQLIDSWASRFLPDADPTGRQMGRQVTAEPGTVVVRSAGDGRYAQQIDTDRHRWRSDEPASVGGSDSGPDPYQLLLSALGACTGITLRMYADRAGIPLDDATITLTHDRLYAKDCAECATTDGHVDRIVREVHLDGVLTEAQRTKLLAIADKCPVHRTLRSEIVIETDDV